MLLPSLFHLLFLKDSPEVIALVLGSDGFSSQHPAKGLG
jgi:hypothetical protein